MAHLAAWDHQGRYDSVLGPMTRYSEEESRASLGKSLVLCHQLPAGLPEHSSSSAKAAETKEAGCVQGWLPGPWEVFYAVSASSSVWFAQLRRRLVLKSRAQEIQHYFAQGKSMIEKGVDFALNVGSQIFTPAGKQFVFLLICFSLSCLM